MSAKIPRYRASGRGVVTATPIVSNVVPELDFHEVSLALDPGIRNPQPGSTQVPQLERSFDRELPIGIVDDDLRDGDRIGTVVHHRRENAVGVQRDTLEHEALDRRIAVASERLRRTPPQQQRHQAGEKDQQQNRD